MLNWIWCSMIVTFSIQKTCYGVLEPCSARLVVIAASVSLIAASTSAS